MVNKVLAVDSHQSNSAVTVVLASELGCVRKLLLATCNHSDIAASVVEVELVAVLSNHCDCVELATLWENNVCCSIVCVDSSLESFALGSVWVCNSGVDSSLESLTWSNGWVTCALDSNKLLSCLNESKCCLVWLNWNSSLDSCVKCLLSLSNSVSKRSLLGKNCLCGLVSGSKSYVSVKHLCIILSN